MERGRLDLLALQMRESFDRLWDRVRDLSDEESFWEPVAGSWTVRPTPDGRWDYDYELPDPDPAPFTTIAWRLNHVAMCKVMYHEHAFGPAELTWDTIEVPGSAEGMLEMLRRGQDLLITDLTDLESDDELQLPRRTNWGEWWPAWKILWTMIWHDAHHGAEIACLRDLYGHTVRDA